jgi:hypothetical protein
LSLGNPSTGSAVRGILGYWQSSIRLRSKEKLALP